MSDTPFALIQFLLALLGWPIKRLARWVDRQPHRDFSQLSVFGKIGRLALMIAATIAILGPLAWLIWG